MAADSDPPKRRKRSRLKIALALSVAFNLLVVGFLAGASVRKGGDMAQQVRAPGLGAFGAPYMMALPRQERRAVLRALRSETRGKVPDRQARRALFQDVLTVLRSTPFDEAALRQAVGQQAETTVFVQKKAQQAWLNVIDQMSDAERLSYADAVEDLLRRASRNR